ncbi:MAG: flavodoxin family protein [Proteobacteria bacterium]|nr:flavodoxin family protein [Pseudomonadota bacterium]
MGGKKILLVMGSPRKEGNSSTRAKQVAAGAKASGAEVESFCRHALNIQPCTACDACREETDKDCVIDDDMQTLYPKLQRADAVVIAWPICWFTISAQMKLFTDRWYAFGGPQEEYAALAGRRIGIVLTYGDLDPFVSGAANALRTFQDAFNYVGAEIVGMIYGTASEAGEILNNRNIVERAYALGKPLASG